jgi:para-nitrobenzyl esterase
MGLSPPSRILFIAIAWLFAMLGPAAWAQAATKSNDPIVKVTGGRVQGRLETSGGAVFKGIPYAAPPLGDLRWREPRAPTPWSGVRQAADYGHACPQVVTDWNRSYATTASEDCLYLNVFTAEWPSTTKKPVMVWIHGGGNWGGSAIGNTSNEPPFDGAGLTPHGIVLVTINYRVGVFGFMGHPELTTESSHHASGNYGFLDQIAALRWVHDNIAKFGGDPGNVTIFGQSAGGQATTILITSPLIKGLVHRAIAESGFPEQGDKKMQTRDQLEQVGILVGKLMNAPSLQALRNVPAAAIVAAMPQITKQLNGLLIDAGVDGYVIPRNSMQVYASGKEAPVPLMEGANSYDGAGSMYIRAAGAAQLHGTPDENAAVVKRLIGSLYGNYPDLRDRALQIYGFNGVANDIAPPYYGAMDMQFGTDVFQRCPGIMIAGWHSAVAPAYHYEFTRGDDSHHPIHTAELKYLFGHLAEWDSGDKGRDFAVMMQEYWTNFARTGDPNGPGLPAWPRYDAKTRQSMDFSNNGPVVRGNLRGTPCAVYTELGTRRLTEQRAN